MADSTQKKVAIVCDWLTGIGGAERVVLEIHKLFPEAPIYTSQYNPKAIDWFLDADVRPLRLQKIPKAFKKFLPMFRARAFSKLNLSEYDLVISSSGAEAKGVKIGPDTVHICYMHAPTHYYWSRYEDYLKNPGFPHGFNWLARIALRIMAAPMKRWDFKAAQRPTHIIANSTFTESQIKKYYKRDSTVVHPPVDVERFSIPHERLGAPNIRNGFVITGRQTPYKRIDLAVAACSESNVPLIVIGKGPQHAKLKRMAGRTVTFLTHVSDEEMPHHLQSAEAFIFPGIDDFGIAAVEALAAGTPVIAYEGGGALDYIIPGKTGLFFNKQTVKSLIEALMAFDPSKFAPGDIKTYARNYSVENFKKNLQTAIQEALQ